MPAINCRKLAGRRSLHKAVIFSVLFFAGLSFLCIVSIPVVHAAVDVGLAPIQSTIKLGGGDPRVLIAQIIRAALGLLGIVAVGIVLYAGFLWMTAGGDEDKVADAKQMLINGVIGLTIILSAVAITQFILNSLITATFGENLAGGKPPGIIAQSGSLGRGIIDMHYPRRGQTDVARNSNIFITFKAPIKISSVIAGYDDNGTPADVKDDKVTTTLNIASIKIYRAGDPKKQPLASDKVQAVVTPDRKTFVFHPLTLLGSASENVLYSVELSGDGLKFENGDPAFTGAFGGGYLWQFETGTFLDVTPPTVTDYFPYPSDRLSPPFPSTTYERNVLIQSNFSEPVDPTSIVNPSDLVVRADGKVVDGVWNIANGYKSAEFVTTSACGTNSCGETIYCLPANATITVQVRAADLTDDQGDGASSKLPYNGVADAAGNSLNDQGNNNIAEGSPTDDVHFGFGTSGAIDITGPALISVNPKVLTGDIAPSTPVTIVSSEVLSRSSINSSSVEVNPIPDHELWYDLGSQNVDEKGNPVVPKGPGPVATQVVVNHGLFTQAPIGAKPQQGYVPVVSPLLRDAYQNCFVPSAGPGPVPNATCTPNPYCCNGVPSKGATCSGVNF